MSGGVNNCVQVPWSSIFVSDRVLQILELLEFLERLFGIGHISAEHANLDLFHVIVHVLVASKFVQEVGSGVPWLDRCLLFVEASAVLNQFVRHWAVYVLDRYFEEDRPKIGQGRAGVALQNELHFLSQTMVVGVPYPLLALVVLFEHVVV